MSAGPACEAAMQAIKAALEKHGVGTYVVVLQDPDSAHELSMVAGIKPWVVGQLTLKLDETIRNYNDAPPLRREAE